ncbi:MAG: sigma-70 family RNA polymerase sigma factor [Verrucomicrobiaceae bacterium]|nr:sigma-70 family RNA polymerase sigma factor [Verrucomicrobiaceae bacterium]
MSLTNGHTPAFAFPATRWSRVARTREGEAGTRALEELCGEYWQPVAGYVRALGCVEEAEDIAQDFFALFLKREGFQRAQQERGTLRSYLKSAIRHHVWHWRRDRSTQRRGGGHDAEELDDELPAEDAEADLAYDQEWALVVLEKALAELRAGYERRGRVELYEQLKPTLLAENTDLDALASRLGITRNALAVEQHRARRRLADLLRQSVLETTNDAAEAEEELIHLLRVLSRT